jgi:hypothetical protein
MTMEAPQGNSSRTLFLLMALYLILMFLWRAIVPGGGWPLPPWHYISMGIDVVLVGCLIALRSRQSDAEPRSQASTTLFWLGVTAGIGSLLIRFTGEGAWWTGHLFNEFPG